MDNLEFELWSRSGIKQDIKSCSVGNQSAEQELNIKHSIKLINLLKAKMKEHNKENPSKRVSLKELKQVYIEAAKTFDEDIPFCINQWSLSRVFLYLRMKKGEKVESTHANIEIGEEIDISIDWTPSEKDLELAAACIKENDLDYEFKDVDGLYLEEYKPISFQWE